MSSQAEAFASRRATADFLLHALSGGVRRGDGTPFHVELERLPEEDRGLPGRLEYNDVADSGVWDRRRLRAMAWPPNVPDEAPSTLFGKASSLQGFDAELREAVRRAKPAPGAAQQDASSGSRRQRQAAKYASDVAEAIEHADITDTAQHQRLAALPEVIPTPDRSSDFYHGFAAPLAQLILGKLTGGHTMPGVEHRDAHNLGSTVVDTAPGTRAVAIRNLLTGPHAAVALPIIQGALTVAKASAQRVGSPAMQVDAAFAAAIADFLVDA